MPRIRVVTDSTCDLPQAWVQQHEIRVVPTYIQFGLESFADDGVEMPRKAFYERMAVDAIHPTTSAPALGQTMAIMQQALDQAEHVLAITAARQLSSLHDTFRLAAQQLDPTRVTLIDSQMVSMGLGWQVLYAAQRSLKQDDPAVIAREVEALQPRLDLWAALDTMEHLRQSGRVGWARAFVGNLFQIKPIIRLHLSEVSAPARARTFHRAFDQLIAYARAAAPLERLAILHTNSPDRAVQLLESLRDLAPDDNTPLIDVTPALGVHVGPDGVGLSVVRKHKPE